jgi:hypothetical protein
MIVHISGHFASLLKVLRCLELPESKDPVVLFVGCSIVKSQMEFGRVSCHTLLRKINACQMKLFEIYECGQDMALLATLQPKKERAMEQHELLAFFKVLEIRYYLIYRMFSQYLDNNGTVKPIKIIIE